MKKIVALFLTLVLTCALICTAFAETGYILVKSVLLRDEYLGSSGTTSAMDEDNNKVLVMAGDITSDTFFIAGRNAKGKPEITSWSNVDQGKIITTFVQLCTAWDTTEECMDTGYSLLLAILLEKDGDWYTVSSSQDAKNLLAIFDE